MNSMCSQRAEGDLGGSLDLVQVEGGKIPIPL